MTISFDSVREHTAGNCETLGTFPRWAFRVGQERVYHATMLPASDHEVWIWFICAQRVACKVKKSGYVVAELSALRRLWNLTCPGVAPEGP
jgi:hypothetical protein